MWFSICLFLNHYNVNPSICSCDIIEFQIHDSLNLGNTNSSSSLFHLCIVTYQLLIYTELIVPVVCIENFQNTSVEELADGRRSRNKKTQPKFYSFNIKSM